jgi:flagellar biosynthesis/type III secretory pathway protein FliH
LTLARGRLVRANDVARTRGVPKRADDIAEALALMMKTRAQTADAEEAAIDRIVSLSRVLAERLLGTALGLEPETIVRLAHGVLAEARSAARILLYAHPAQVAVLESATAAFDPEGRVHRICADSALGMGDVRLETELGTVEARLDAELDRLARRLRDVLRS